MDELSYKAFLLERRRELMERIEQAAARSGRAAEDVELLAVSKTVGPDEVRLAFEAGYRLFGENRPQELKRKCESVCADASLVGITFDMIGNLQTNKINQVLGRARLVHSVSSVHLAKALGSRAASRGITLRCLLEVNVSGEATKAGFSPEEARRALDCVLDTEGLALEGVMSMAPAHDTEAARATFSGLRELAELLRRESGLALPVLSCGMSDDFELAVEEGSTLVRLGRIVFDPAYANG